MKKLSVFVLALVMAVNSLSVSKAHALADVYMMGHPMSYLSWCAGIVMLAGVSTQCVCGTTDTVVEKCQGGDLEKGEASTPSCLDRKWTVPGTLGYIGSLVSTAGSLMLDEQGTDSVAIKSFSKADGEKIGLTDSEMDELNKYRAEINSINETILSENTEKSPGKKAQLVEKKWAEYKELISTEAMSALLKIAQHSLDEAQKASHK